MKLFKIILNTIPRPLLIKLSYVARPFIAFYLKGNTYTDPIDGESFRKFLPYGYGTQRPNVLSPSTLSLERHRLLWLYLNEETDFFTKKKKVLHMAPEQCFLKRFQKLNHDYITADLYSPIADVPFIHWHLLSEHSEFFAQIWDIVVQSVPKGSSGKHSVFLSIK